MSFNHPCFTLPEGVDQALLRDRVRHALESERAVGEANDEAAIYDDAIQAADAFIDEMRESGIDPLTGSEHESVFDYMDFGDGDDPLETWSDDDDHGEDNW